MSVRSPIRTLMMPLRGLMDPVPLKRSQLGLDWDW